MRTLALVVVAAFVFTVLAGLAERREAGRMRRRLMERAVIFLHPLTHHTPGEIRRPPLQRARHHLGLFLGFLLVAYLALALLKGIYDMLQPWF